MLGVDRQERRAPVPGQGHEQTAGDHQGLLVGQGQGAAALELGDGGAEARGADDPVQGHVVVFRGDQLGGGVRTCQDPRPGRQGRPELVRTLGVGEGHGRHVELPGEGGDGVHGRAGGQAGDAEAPRVLPQELDALSADGAAAAEDEEGTHGDGARGLLA